MTTSTLAISFSTASRPCADFKSIAMLFLLRLYVGKKPAPEATSFRVWSPSSGSTLMTSAPRSARIKPQVGPMTT
ncbi:hypothetical protein D3C83_91020 [compost metagenome]